MIHSSNEAGGDAGHERRRRLLTQLCILPALSCSPFSGSAQPAAGAPASTAGAPPSTGGTPPSPAAIAQREAAMFSRSSGYERFMGRWSRLLVPGLAAFAGVRDGDRVLDVGTGTGALASGLVKALPGTRIVGIDPSEAFVSHARAADPGGRVRYELGDVQALRFPDGAFDQTIALLVMNFVPDHRKAIAEMRRVTRPDGVVSACVWDYDAGMRMIRIFWDEVVALDPSLAAKDQRNMKLVRQGQLGELWRSAGLVDVREEPLTIEQSFASFDDYWQPFLERTGASGALVDAMAPEARQRLEARVRGRVVGDRADGPFTLEARAWCVRGRVG